MYYSFNQHYIIILKNIYFKFMDGLSNQYDPNHPIVKETINCLIKTFTEKDNTERSKAENTLKELGKYH